MKQFLQAVCAAVVAGMLFPGLCLAAEAKVKTVVISHVTEQIDQPGVRERVVREMAEIYPGNIVFGADLMEVPVKGPVAAKLL